VRAGRQAGRSALFIYWGRAVFGLHLPGMGVFSGVGGLWIGLCMGGRVFIFIWTSSGHLHSLIGIANGGWDGLGYLVSCLLDRSRWDSGI